MPCNFPTIEIHSIYKEHNGLLFGEVFLNMTLTSLSANRMSRKTGATTNKSVVTVTSIAIIPRSEKTDTKLFKSINIKLGQSELQAALQSES